MALYRVTGSSSKTKHRHEQSGIHAEAQSHLRDRASGPSRDVAELGRGLSDLSIHRNTADTPKTRDKGKQREGSEVERQIISAPEQYVKMQSPGGDKGGIYAGRYEDRALLQELGYGGQAYFYGRHFPWKIIQKTDYRYESAHLVDTCVAMPFPHLSYNDKDPDRAKVEAVQLERNKFKALGVAYNEKGIVHQKHVGSHKTETDKEFNRAEHAWSTISDYRLHAKIALRQVDAKDWINGQPTTLSNVIQLNLLDFAHVQKSYITKYRKFGLYDNAKERECSDVSFKNSVSKNPIHYYIKDKRFEIGKAGASPAQLNTQPIAAETIQDDRIVGRRLTSQEQTELILARGILQSGEYPSQETVESVAREFLPQHEFNEKQALWAAQDAAGNRAAQRVFDTHMKGQVRKLGERSEEANYPASSDKNSVKSRRHALQLARKRREDDALETVEKTKSDSPSRLEIDSVKAASVRWSTEDAEAQRIFESRIKSLNGDTQGDIGDKFGNLTAAEQKALDICLAIEKEYSDSGMAALRIRQTAAQQTAALSHAQWIIEDRVEDLRFQLCQRREDEAYPLPADWKRGDDTRSTCRLALKPYREAAAERASKTANKIEEEGISKGKTGVQIIDDLKQEASQYRDKSSAADQKIQRKVSVLQQGSPKRSGQTSDRTSGSPAQGAVVFSSSDGTLSERGRTRELSRG